MSDTKLLHSQDPRIKAAAILALDTEKGQIVWTMVKNHIRSYDSKATRKLLREIETEYLINTEDSDIERAKVHDYFQGLRDLLTVFAKIKANKLKKLKTIHNEWKDYPLK